MSRIKKKRQVLLIVLFIILSNIVYSESNDPVKLEIIKKECDQEGRLILEVRNPNPTILNTDEIIINVSSIQLSVKGIHGNWSRKKIYGYEYLEEWTKANAVFISEKGYLKYEGDYTIYVTYPNCIKHPELCVEEVVVSDCPGYKYDCNITNITITSCYTQGDFFHFTYQGLNKGQQEKISPVYDVSYMFGRPRRVTMSAPKIEGFQVRKDGMNYTSGMDKYYGNFPVDDDYNITQIQLYVKKCGHKSIVEKNDCRFIEDCKLADDCSEGQTCTNNECVSLQCGVCQEARNHQCVSKCDDNDSCTKDSCENDKCTYTKIEDCCKSDTECGDNLVCTVDKCINNKCVYSDLECESTSDPCVIGTCKEPNGCEYSLNPKCPGNKITGAAVAETKKEGKISLIQRIINWFRGVFS